jgi:hypothetical protein
MVIDCKGEVSLDELTLSEDRFESLCVLPESLDQFEFVTLADANNDGVATLSELRSENCEFISVTTDRNIFIHPKLRFLRKIANYDTILSNLVWS